MTLRLMSAPRSWSWDADAILEAIDLLGIREPVVIRTSVGRRTVGCCRWKPERVGVRARAGHHSITVSGLRPASESGRTLWHELVHAMQCERFDDPADFQVAYRRAGVTGRRYENNPFEVEARDISDLNDDLPLLR